MDTGMGFSDLLRRSFRPLQVVALAVLAAPTLAAEPWNPVRVVDGVAVEARSTESGFNVHRGATKVCTDLAALETFVEDTAAFENWLPYTRSARLLDRTPASVTYYVRTSTPWPMRDRDMIYQISRQQSPDGTEEGLRLTVTGLPDYLSQAENAERIRAASGEWYLAPRAGGIQVSYQLYVDPGAVPAFIANRRLATAVGQTLANLAAIFPCAPG